MPRTLGEIARHLNGILEGDSTLEIGAVRGVESAGPHEIALVADAKYLGVVATSRAGALVVPEGCSVSRGNLIRVREPKAALVPLLRLFAPVGRIAATSIAPGAHVSKQAVIGKEVSVAAGACVEDGVVIGDRVRIHANAVIGEGASIGDDSIIHPNVTIYPRTRIGRRVVIHAGSVIGADGFGYVQSADGHDKIPHLGIVEIEDDVEIGANCAIDRATLEITRIGAGTKIDNLVQIGHNSAVGRNVIIVAQAGVAGSVTVGDGTMLGGQSGISDHVRIGPNVMIGAKSGVHADIESGVWIGSPALPREKAGRMHAFLPHLPEYRERVRTLETEVEMLKKAIERLVAQKPDDAETP